MEVEKSSRRSCFTQTSCLGADLGEDSQLEYLSAHEEYEEEKSNWSEFSEQEEVAEVKAVPPRITAGEEASGKSLRPSQSVAAEPDIASLPPSQEAQPCKQGEPSYFSSCETPARGTSSTAEGADTQLPAPEILPGKNPPVEAADKSSAGRSERGDALRSVPSVAVDVGSDPRAGFPASSAQVCLCSRAVSTEVTVVSRAPQGWLGQTSVDAASNTEWPTGALSSHLQEELKDHLGWKTGTDRPAHPSKQTGKNCASSCCQNVLQRAIEAELQLLAIHYEMCYQHCLKVYELALEENTCLGRCEKKAELHSSLLLALDELDNNYSTMRKEINVGTPLNELPPLSVELKFPPLSSFYTASKFFRKILYSDSRLCFSDLSGEGKADFEEPKQQEKGISVNMVGNSSLLGFGDDHAEKTTQRLMVIRQVTLFPLRGCVKNEEGSEYWFDAKEDLSVADISVMCKEMKKQQGKQDSIDSRGKVVCFKLITQIMVFNIGVLCSFSKLKYKWFMFGGLSHSDGCEVKIVVSGKEHSSVPVGDPKPSVPEDPGENSLQKTSTCSSLKSSCIFVSPYALNLSSFTKLVRRLQDKHPEFSRAEIVGAVQEVRRMNKGVLSGLAISAIEEKASAILRSSTPYSQ
ncbi:RNA-binding protein 44 [Melospiza georgiana]|uniref:RNA-binding protein 44 n=1 Tax=Melospiza georgiana TaxID=44398 RepID=UPI0025AD8956|nr:RNA-binding protein 44 [Melospiza georgiana]